MKEAHGTKDEQQRLDNRGISATNTNLVGRLVSTQFSMVEKAVGSKENLTNKANISLLRYEQRKTSRGRRSFRFIVRIDSPLQHLLEQSGVVVVDENPFGQEKSGTSPFCFCCTFENSDWPPTMGWHKNLSHFFWLYSHR